MSPVEVLLRQADGGIHLSNQSHANSSWRTIMKLKSVLFALSVLFVISSQVFSVPGAETKKAGKSGGTGKKPTVAYVTNGIASFWDIAEKGANDAGAEFNANVKVIMPPKGVADQKRMVQEVLAQHIDGVAISPIDPDNQEIGRASCRERV